jgi:hypothetical protein
VNDADNECWEAVEDNGRGKQRRQRKQRKQRKKTEEADEADEAEAATPTHDAITQDRTDVWVPMYMGACVITN